MQDPTARLAFARKHTQASDANAVEASVRVGIFAAPSGLALTNWERPSVSEPVMKKQEEHMSVGAGASHIRMLDRRAAHDERK